MRCVQPSTKYLDSTAFVLRRPLPNGVDNGFGTALFGEPENAGRNGGNCE